MYSLSWSHNYNYAISQSWGTKSSPSILSSGNAYMAFHGKTGLVCSCRVMIMEIPVLKFLIGVTIDIRLTVSRISMVYQLLLVLGRLSLEELDTIVHWLSYDVA